MKIFPHIHCVCFSVYLVHRGMCAHVFLHGDGWELYVSITCVAACGKCCHTLCAPFIVNSHCNRDRAAAAKLEPHISDHVVVRPQSVVLSFASFLTLGNCCSLTKCFFHTIFSFFNIRTHRLFTYFSLCLYCLRTACRLN